MGTGNVSSNIGVGGGGITTIDDWRDRPSSPSDGDRIVFNGLLATYSGVDSEWKVGGSSGDYVLEDWSKENLDCWQFAIGSSADNTPADERFVGGNFRVVFSSDAANTKQRGLYTLEDFAAPKSSGLIVHFKMVDGLANSGNYNAISMMSHDYPTSDSTNPRASTNQRANTGGYDAIYWGRDDNMNIEYGFTNFSGGNGVQEGRLLCYHGVVQGDSYRGTHELLDANGQSQAVANDGTPSPISGPARPTFHAYSTDDVEARVEIQKVVLRLL